MAFPRAELCNLLTLPPSHRLDAGDDVRGWSSVESAQHAHERPDTNSEVQSPSRVPIKKFKDLAEPRQDGR